MQIPLTCAKSFQAAESLSVCVLVLLFSTVVIARNHKSIISILCLYKTGHLKWVQKGRVAGHNKTWEGQREKYIKKKWDRVLSYSTGSKICLLKNAIIVFFCSPAFFFFRSLHESNEKTLMFSMQTSGCFRWVLHIKICNMIWGFADGFFFVLKPEVGL